MGWRVFARFWMSGRCLNFLFVSSLLAGLVLINTRFVRVLMFYFSSSCVLRLFFWMEDTVALRCCLQRPGGFFALSWSGWLGETLLAGW